MTEDGGRVLKEGKGQGDCGERRGREREAVSEGEKRGTDGPNLEEVKSSGEKGAVLQKVLRWRKE